MHLLTLLLLIAGGLLAFKWLQRQPRAVRKKAALKIALAAVGLLVLVGVLNGRLNPMTLVVTALAAIPMLGKLLDAKQLFERLSSGNGLFKGPRSRVSTRFLKMTLEHNGGATMGEVTRGRFRGRSLAELTTGQLMELLRECQGDPQSVTLLETYLDRTLGTQWRDAAVSPNMSADEAREILGLDMGATRDSVVAAHRKLMQKLHPDRGGSTYLAAQVNQAKKVLLASL